MSSKSDKWLHVTLRVCADCPFAEEGDDVDEDAEPVFYCKHPKCEERDPLDVFAIPPWCPIRSEPVVLCVPALGGK